MTALEPILFMLFFPLTTYTFRFVSGGFFFLSLAVKFQGPGNVKTQ